MNQNEFRFKVTLSEFFVLLLFYFFFSLIYHATLAYLLFDETTGFWTTFLQSDNYWYQSVFAYIIFFVASVGIWFLGIYLKKIDPLVCK